MTVQPGSGPATSARELLRKTSEELDRLFEASPAGPIPVGECVGTGIACPGSLCARWIAWFLRCFVWQGKVFDGTTLGTTFPTPIAEFDPAQFI